MKYSTKIAKEAGTNIIGEMYGGAARFTFIGLMARFVGPEFLGFYSIANAITRIFGVFGMAGLDRGILRYVSFNLGEKDNKSISKWIKVALKLGFIFGFFSVIMQFTSSNYITSKFYNGNVDIQNAINYFSIILFFSIVSGIAAHSTQGFKILKYKVLTIQVIQPTILLITLIFLYNIGISNFHQITLPLILAEILGFIFMFYFLKKINPIKIISIFKEPFNVEIIKFSFPLMLVGLLGMIMHWIDILMLGYFLPPKDVGIYQPAVRTTGIIRLFLVSFSGIFTPMIAELISKNAIREMEQIYKLTCRWIITLAVPFFIIVIVRSEQIMMLFGNDFLEGANLLLLLLSGMLFQAIGNPAGSTLVMAGKTKLVLLNTIFISIINIFLNIVLIPKMGLMGAAWGTAISLIFLCIIRIFIIWFLYNIVPFELKNIKSILGGIFTFGFFHFIKPVFMNYHFIINLIISSSIVIFIYFVALYMMKLEQEDIDVLKSIKLKIKGA